MKVELIDVDSSEAKRLLGWEVLSKESLQKRLYDGLVDDSHVIKDFFNLNVGLMRTSSNRPLRKTVVIRYVNDLILNKWRVNGDSIVIDSDKNVVNGQHRLVAIVLANQLLELRKLNSKKFPKKLSYLLPVIDWRYNNDNMDISILCPVVYLDQKYTEVDFDMSIPYDTGLKRTLSDVLYKTVFDGRLLFQELDGKDRVKLCRILSVALRLVWLRVKGKFVSDAPHFPHYEACEFLSENMGLEDSVLDIYNMALERGNKSVTEYISMGYAAGLHYLMNNTGVKEVGDLGHDFFELFVSSDNDPVIQSLKSSLKNLDAGSGSGRDRKIKNMIVAASIITKNWTRSVGDYLNQLKNGEEMPIKYSEFMGLVSDKVNENIRMRGIDSKINEASKIKAEVISEIKDEMGIKSTSANAGRSVEDLF